MQFRIRGSHAFAIVCDGLGGHCGGERASRTAVDAAIAGFAADLLRIDRDALSSWLEAAHAGVRDMQNASAEFANMRTTAVALLTDGESAVWAHAGDSRLYHLRAGRIVAQTRDHSVPQLLADAGEIDASGIRFHEDRNRLLRALGSAVELKITGSTKIDVVRGDAFLLCTDGFWEWVLEEEMEAALLADPAAWLDSMERILLAKASGDFDNYSAVAVVTE